MGLAGDVLTQISRLIETASSVRSYSSRCPDDTAGYEKTLKRLCKRRFVKTFERSYILQILASAGSVADVTDETQIAAEEERALNVADQVDAELATQQAALLRDNDELERLLHQIESDDTSWRSELEALKNEFSQHSAEIFSPDPNYQLIDAAAMEQINSNLLATQNEEAELVRQMESLEISMMAPCRRTADLLPVFSRLLLQEIFARRIELADSLEDLTDNFGFAFDDPQTGDNISELLLAVEEQAEEIRTCLENEVSLIEALSFLKPSGIDTAEVKGQKKLAVTFLCPPRSALFHVTSRAPSNVTPKEIVLIWDDEKNYFSDLLFRVGHKKSGTDVQKLEETIRNWKKSLGVGSALAVVRFSLYPLLLGI